METGHKAVFLKAFYSATDAEDVTAADNMFEKNIDVWILVYKIPYRRAPRLAYRSAFRPSASREQRYLAYNVDPRDASFSSI